MILVLFPPVSFVILSDTVINFLWVNLRDATEGLEVVGVDYNLIADVYVFWVVKKLENQSGLFIWIDEDFI